MKYLESKVNPLNSKLDLIIELLGGKQPPTIDISTLPVNTTLPANIDDLPPLAYHRPISTKNAFEEMENKLRKYDLNPGYDEEFTMLRSQIVSELMFLCIFYIFFFLILDMLLFIENSKHKLKNKSKEWLMQFIYVSVFHTRLT
jgi:hypothetical protein